MLFISGTRDKLFPVPGVEAAFGLMRDVWRDAGAPSALATHLIDRPHEYNLDNQRMVLEFMEKALK